VPAGGYVTESLLANYEAAGGNLAGVTVIRTHLHVVVTTTSTAGDSLTLGIIRGQTTDIGVNIVGAPDPTADLYEDWALWKRYAAGASGAGPTYSGMTSDVWDIDLKSQRRIPELQMSWNLVFGATQAVDVDASARVLLALP